MAPQQSSTPLTLLFSRHHLPFAVAVIVGSLLLLHHIGGATASSAPIARFGPFSFSDHPDDEIGVQNAGVISAEGNDSAILPRWLRHQRFRRQEADATTTPGDKNVGSTNKPEVADNKDNDKGDTKGSFTSQCVRDQLGLLIGLIVADVLLLLLIIAAVVYFFMVRKKAKGGGTKSTMSRTTMGKTTAKGGSKMTTKGGSKMMMTKGGGGKTTKGWPTTTKGGVTTKGGAMKTRGPGGRGRGR